MKLRQHTRSPGAACLPRRRGVAAAELAVLLPLLAFLTLVVVDFAQVFYHAQTIDNCARNGALYGSKVFNIDASQGYDEDGNKIQAWQGPSSTKYSAIKAAVLADATSLEGKDGYFPPLEDDDITIDYDGVDDEGHPCVAVTVTYHCPLLTNFTIPGLFQIGNTLTKTKSDGTKVITHGVNLTRTVRMRIASD